MAKLFVILTVAVLCFSNVLALSVSNATSAELVPDSATDEPTFLPSSIETSTENKNQKAALLESSTDETITHKVTSTFPPLVHNPDPETAPTTIASKPEEPPKVPPTGVETSVEAKTVKAAPPTSETTKAPTHATETKSAPTTKSETTKKPHNSSNVFQGSVIILFLCLMATKFGY